MKFLLNSGYGTFSIRLFSLLLIPLCLSIPQFLQAQDETEEEVYTTVDEMPEFPGGEEAMFDYINTNKHYPQEALDRDISGIVFINFVVTKKGEIKKVKVLRGIGGGCDEEAVRVTGSMPVWTPGKQNGKSVSVSYNIPIRFGSYQSKPDPASIKVVGVSFDRHKDHSYSSAPSYGEGKRDIEIYFNNRIAISDSHVKEGVKGVMEIQFTLDEHSNVENPFIKKGFHHFYNFAVKDAVMEMKQWKAAKKDGKEIPSTVTITLEIDSTIKKK